MNQTRIILFDGVCNLCNRSVQFIIKRDSNKLFRFAALQSEAGRNILQQYNIPSLPLDSIIYIENGKYFLRSTAVLRIFRQLKAGWPLLSVFLVVPAVVRDAVYKLISGNRYRFFGKRNECMVPEKDLSDRFL